MSQHSSTGRAWTKTAEGIKARDGYVCQLRYGNCTVDQDLTVDHRMPKSKGGTDDEWNLVTACRSCNGTKKDKVELRMNWLDNDWMNG